MDIWSTNLTASTSVTPQLLSHFSSASGHDNVSVQVALIFIASDEDWSDKQNVCAFEILYEVTSVKSKIKYLLLCKRWRSNTLRSMTGDTILLSVWQQLSEMSGDNVYAEAVNKLSQVWMGMSVKLKSVGCRLPSRLSQWLPCSQFIREVCVCVCVRWCSNSMCRKII